VALLPRHFVGLTARSKVLISVASVGASSASERPTRCHRVGRGRSRGQPKWLMTIHSPCFTLLLRPLPASIFAPNQSASAALVFSGTRQWGGSSTDVPRRRKAKQFGGAGPSGGISCPSANVPRCGPRRFGFEGSKAMTLALVVVVCGVILTAAIAAYYTL
jgi:hypothetical protein